MSGGRDVRWLGYAPLVSLLLVLGGAVLTARSVIEGQAELAQSDLAFHRGEVRIATLHARRAAILYAPGAPHLSLAYARLMAVAQGAEAAGDREVAVMAWNAVREAALETRHLWIPRAQELERANANLARLEAGAAPFAGHTPSPEEVVRRRREAEQELRRDDAPRAPWALVLGLSFLLLSVGLLGISRRGLAPDGTVLLGQSRYSVLAVALGTLFWILAAWQS